MSSDDASLPEHVRRNREWWGVKAAEYAAGGARAWARNVPTWAFGMYRVEWPDDPGVEFHLGHGDWLRLLRRSGFEVEDLIEVQAPEGGQTSYQYVTLDWARQWPAEEIWKARRRT